MPKKKLWVQLNCLFSTGYVSCFLIVISYRMKLAIATVAVLVCLFGMKGILADEGYGYGGNYGLSYGSMGGWGSSKYGLSGYGKSGYSGYGKSGYHGGYVGGFGSGYGKKGYSGYGKKGGFVDETIIMPGVAPVGVGIGAGVGAGVGGGLFGGDSVLPLRKSQQYYDFMLLNKPCKSDLKPNKHILCKVK